MEYHSMLYKYSQFCEEKEYRITYRYGTRYYENSTTNTTLLRLRLEKFLSIVVFLFLKEVFEYLNNRLSSYYELSFDDIREHIISKIILGPKCQIDPADIRMFLKDYGYDADIKIQRSEIPYR